MIDRLEDFRRMVRVQGLSLERPKDVPINIESDEMREFSSLITSGNIVINKLNDETDKLKLVKDRVLNAVGDKEAQLKIETDECLSNLNMLRKKGKELADNMKVQATAFKEKIHKKAIENEDPNEGKAEIRVIDNLSGSFINNFCRVLSYSQNVESDVKNRLQEKLLRGVGIILGRDPNEEEKKIYLENPEKYQELVDNRITQGQAHIVLQNRLKDLQLRHKEILQLENVS